ncbi:hypothetical protein PSH12_13630 [Enterococcus casseliflavus]|uniref:hypothetical protein n=1 Tax=Enterococcus casseliflavus TaxID=37734 RepID=UPI002953F008|nr:hypothetical protein [Enterococcus casseliflavus]MDV7713637.1 hypothetical protein [Enterococcus casseliflavus]
MGLFGKSKYKEEILVLKKTNSVQNKRIKQLENLCEEKDSFFKELMSDATKHGSSLGAKHMSDRAKYLKDK